MTRATLSTNFSVKRSGSQADKRRHTKCAISSEQSGLRTFKVGVRMEDVDQYPFV